MTDETRPFELEVRVREHGQPDAVLHREVVSSKASTDGVLAEVWAAVSDDAKARMRPVGDDR